MMMMCSITHALISSWHCKLLIVIQRVPVMFRGVSRIPAPVQIPPCDIALNNIFHHTARKQPVCLALEELKVDVERVFGSESVVKDGLLVSLTPTMSPVILHSFHVHSAPV